jgi:hypothetical protein
MSHPPPQIPRTITIEERKRFGTPRERKSAGPFLVARNRSLIVIVLELDFCHWLSSEHLRDVNQS